MNKLRVLKNPSITRNHNWNTSNYLAAILITAY